MLLTNAPIISTNMPNRRGRARVSNERSESRQSNKGRQFSNEVQKTSRERVATESSTKVEWYISLTRVRSHSTSALTFHSVHVAAKKDRSFRFPCRKTNSGSRQGAQPTLSPTAWRINARSLYELDGVRVEQIVRTQPAEPGEKQRGRQRENSPFLNSYVSTYTLEANDPFQSRQHYPTPRSEPGVWGRTSGISARQNRSVDAKADNPEPRHSTWLISVSAIMRFIENHHSHACPDNLYTRRFIRGH